MMFIVPHLNFLHTPRSLGMVLSELFGNKIEIRNFMKNQDDVKCPNKSSQYFAHNYFYVSYYFKIAMPWHVFHLPPPSCLDGPSWHRPPIWGSSITLRHSTLGKTPWTSDRPVAEPSNWQHTTPTRNRHPCRQRDSNLESQERNGRGPTPWPARPLGSV